MKARNQPVSHFVREITGGIGKFMKGLGCLNIMNSLQLSFYPNEKREDQEGSCVSYHVIHTHSSPLPALRAKCGGRGPPMVVGKPPPVVAAVSGISVSGGGGGATCKRKSQGRVSILPSQGLVNFFILKGGPCVTPS